MYIPYKARAHLRNLWLRKLGSSARNLQAYIHCSSPPGVPRHKMVPQQQVDGHQIPEQNNNQKRDKTEFDPRLFNADLLCLYREIFHPINANE